MQNQEAKEKISITLNKKTLTELDKYRNQKFSVPRSQIIDKAILDFLKKEKEGKK